MDENSGLILRPHHRSANDVRAYVGKARGWLLEHPAKHGLLVAGVGCVVAGLWGQAQTDVQLKEFWAAYIFLMSALGSALAWFYLSPWPPWVRAVASLLAVTGAGYFAISVVNIEGVQPLGNAFPFNRLFLPYRLSLAQKPASATESATPHLTGIAVTGAVAAEPGTSRFETVVPVYYGAGELIPPYRQGGDNPIWGFYLRIREHANTLLLFKQLSPKVFGASNQVKQWYLTEIVLSYLVERIAELENDQAGVSVGPEGVKSLALQAWAPPPNPVNFTQKAVIGAVELAAHNGGLHSIFMKNFLLQWGFPVPFRAPQNTGIGFGPVTEYDGSSGEALYIRNDKDKVMLTIGVVPVGIVGSIEMLPGFDIPKASANDYTMVTLSIKESVDIKTVDEALRRQYEQWAAALFSGLKQSMTK